MVLCLILKRIVEQGIFCFWMEALWDKNNAKVIEKVRPGFKVKVCFETKRPLFEFLD